MDSKNDGISQDVAMHEYTGEKHGIVEEGGLSDPNHVELQRALKARHITMIGMLLFVEGEKARRRKS